VRSLSAVSENNPGVQFDQHVRHKIFLSLLSACLLIVLFVVPSVAQRDSLSNGYPDSLQEDLDHLIRAVLKPR